MLARLGLLVLALPVIVGCGSPGEPVGTARGKITYQGAPVTEGTVSFANSQLAAFGEGPIQSDGTYVLATQGAGLPPGVYQVAIVPPMVESTPAPGIAPAPIPKEMPNIPKKYRTIETSGLEATVQEGDNTFDFDMK